MKIVSLKIFEYESDFHSQRHIFRNEKCFFLRVFINKKAGITFWFDYFIEKTFNSITDADLSKEMALNSLNLTE